ncbi:hypothetical protein JMJ56_27510 [Belnapia sp. T18]|uniref:Uncharacterized protein n=1 Tax=Belnapia arida TaxID=2804533 RepID=A0ABS1UAP6_9PROT|nr:hypothetical protein [Belnapia arida]MBL6081734.1 hypothetical protein [Belnapia arida]
MLTLTAPIVNTEAEALNMSAEAVSVETGAMTVAACNLAMAAGAIELFSVPMVANTDLLTVNGEIIELGESFTGVGGDAGGRRAGSTAALTRSIGMQLGHAR